MYVILNGSFERFNTEIDKNALNCIHIEVYGKYYLI